jgi:hypothetical protein
MRGFRRVENGLSGTDTGPDKLSVQWNLSTLLRVNASDRGRMVPEPQA